MQLSKQLSTQKRISSFLFPLFAAVVLSCISHAADESEYTIRASVSEVRLVFAASDRQGHVIKNLRPTDVAVADNGSIIRHFRSFRPASESPLELMILLDASDSVASRISQEIADVKSFVENSTWGDRDRISILTFGGPRSMLVCARNCNAAITLAKLDSLRAGGLTPLYDALFEAAEILGKEGDPELRPAMILISDGADTISMHGESDALKAMQNVQAAIYSVNSRSSKSAPDRGDAVLNYLAGSTGGLSFAPGRNIKESLHAVLEDLHSGYVLTYELPVHMAGQHSVRILPTVDPRLQFRARRAYDDSRE